MTKTTFEKMYDPSEIVLVDLDAPVFQVPIDDDDAALTKKHTAVSTDKFATHFVGDYVAAMFPPSTVKMLSEAAIEHAFTNLNKFEDIAYPLHNMISHRSIVRHAMFAYLSNPTAHTILFKSKQVNIGPKMRSGMRVEAKQSKLTKIVAARMRRLFPNTIYCVQANFTVREEGDELDTCYAVLCMSETASSRYTANVNMLIKDAGPKGIAELFSNGSALDMIRKPSKQIIKYQKIGKHLDRYDRGDIGSYYNPNINGLIPASSLIDPDNGLDIARLRTFFNNARCNDEGMCEWEYRLCAYGWGVPDSDDEDDYDEDHDDYYDSILNIFGLDCDDMAIINYLGLPTPKGSVYIKPKDISKILFTRKPRHMTFAITCENGVEFANLIRTYAKMISDMSDMTPDEFNKTYNFSKEDFDDGPEDD